MTIQACLDVASCRDQDTFERRLVSFAQQLEFPLVSAVLVVDRPAASSMFVALGNTPEAYRALSENPSYAKGDPVMQRLKILSHPFTYNQQLYVNEGAGDRWESQAPYGYQSGIALALHMPHGRHFLLGVDRDAPLPRDDRELTRLLGDLHLFAAYAQETAVRLLMPTAALEEPMPRLSPRELEVLRWSMEGKSAQDVADILGLSVRTVNFHVAGVCKKLGVASKGVAVAKAVRLGLLS